MKVGDLVCYGSWYLGKRRSGIILEEADMFFLVAWEDDFEWEDKEEIRMINDGR